MPRVLPAWCGLETGPAITFFAFWLLNMLIVHLGIESIRKLLLFKAVFLPLAALALLVWAIIAAKGLGPILAQPSKFATAGEFWHFFFPALTGDGRLLGDALAEYSRLHPLCEIATGADHGPDDRAAAVDDGCSRLWA